MKERGRMEEVAFGQREKAIKLRRQLIGCLFDPLGQEEEG